MFAKMKMSFPGGQYLESYFTQIKQRYEMVCNINYEEKRDWRSEPDLDCEPWVNLIPS